MLSTTLNPRLESLYLWLWLCERDKDRKKVSFLEGVGGSGDKLRKQVYLQVVRRFSEELRI